MKRGIAESFTLLFLAFSWNSCSSDEVEIPEEPVYPIIYEEDNIEFEDAKVKEICVANWDTGHDGELSYWEAAHVRDLGDVFKGNTEIKTFKELKHFIFLNYVVDSFAGCNNLQSLEIPERVKVVLLMNLPSLTELILPEKLEGLELSYTPLLQSLQLPNAMKYIKIAGVPLITSLQPPSSVIDISVEDMEGLIELETDAVLERAVITHNQNLTNIRINNKVQNFYLAFLDALKEVTFDNEIDNVVFEKNPQLQRVHFNAPIGLLTFANHSSLETFDYTEITKSLQIINMEKLHTIHSRALNPSSKFIVENSPCIKQIIIPKGSAEAYNTNEYWNKYSSLFEESEQ